MQLARILVPTALVILGASPSVLAQEFLGPQEAAAVIADGRPWTAETHDGMHAKVTLKKDGSGEFAGPMTIPSDWKLKGEALCIHNFIAGEKCLRFRKVANGYEGWEGSQLDLKLSR